MVSLETHQLLVVAEVDLERTLIKGQIQEQRTFSRLLSAMEVQ